MRATIGAAVVALLLVATGLAQAADSPLAPQSASGKAKVRLLDPAPLTLRGIDFAPVEPVRLTVSLGERTVVRKLVATPAGTFTAAFSAMRYNRCNASLEVTASGRKGTRVSWELVPLECPTRADA